MVIVVTWCDCDKETNLSSAMAVRVKVDMLTETHCNNTHFTHWTYVISDQVTSHMLALVSSSKFAIVSSV